MPEDAAHAHPRVHDTSVQHHRWLARPRLPADRAEKEALNLSSRRPHENVVAFRGVVTDEHDAIQYIVMELLNGGWVSNDEAGCTFVDIIDQHSLGGQFIAKEFGPNANPRVGWQLDPFGHSLFQAKAYAQMGMDAWFFARTDRQDFDVRVANRSLETIHSGIFTGILDHYLPPPDLNFGTSRRRKPDWTVSKLKGFIQMCEKTAEWYNMPNATTRHLLLTMGDDLDYTDAKRWFRNMDLIINTANADGRVNVLYSTPNLYVASRAAQDREWTSRSDYDWFPYCDSAKPSVLDPSTLKVQAAEGRAQWTGYFTSRPGLKRLVREASTVLEACRLAELLVSTPPASTNTSNPPTVLWDALSVAQHHDGITGTARAFVARDYVRLLTEGIEGCKSFISQAVGANTSDDGVTRSTWMYRSMLTSSNGGESVTDDESSASADASSPADDATATAGDGDGGGVNVYFAYYNSVSGKPPVRPAQKSGAYIFRPDCKEGDVAPCRPTRFPDNTPWVKHKQYPDRVEWEVGPIPKSGAGTEVVLIIEPKVRIANKGVFFTDSNAFQWMRREVNKRPTWDYLVTDPVAANYYPVTAGIAIVDAANALIVTPDRSVGGTSLVNGQIEIMVHRRTEIDDAKGIGEKDTLREINNATGRDVSIKGTTFFTLLPTNGDSSAPPAPVSLAQLRPVIPIGEATVDEQKRLLEVVNLPKGSGVTVTHVHRVDVPALCVLSSITDCVLVRLLNPEGSSAASARVDLTSLLPKKAVVAATETVLHGGMTVEAAAARKIQWTSSDGDSPPPRSPPLNDEMTVDLYVGEMRTFIIQINLNQDDVVVDHGDSLEAPLYEL